MSSFQRPHRCHRLSCRRCRPRPSRRVGPVPVAVTLIQLLGALLSHFRE